jgi:hypothetical protein
MLYRYKFSICLKLIVPWEINTIQNNELDQKVQQMETQYRKPTQHQPSTIAFQLLVYGFHVYYEEMQ